LVKIEEIKEPIYDKSNQDTKARLLEIVKAGKELSLLNPYFGNEIQVSIKNKIEIS
jgi:hypothetical protein